MSGHESYRKKAADDLKAISKSERPTKLAELKKTDDYWGARVDKLKERGDKVQFSEDRTTLTWKTKNLYHGTAEPGIEVFKNSEESTIGNNAVYFAVDPAIAIGYARLRRQERKAEDAHLYEVTLNNVALQNWAENYAVNRLKKDYAEYASLALREMGQMSSEDFRAKYGITAPVQDWTVHGALERIIDVCASDELHGGNIKRVAQGLMGVFFEKFVKDRGFDGVITLEQGDDDVYTAKPGVSVVIFNADKIASLRAVAVASQAPEL